MWVPKARPATDCAAKSKVPPWKCPGNWQHFPRPPPAAVCYSTRFPTELQDNTELVAVRRELHTKRRTTLTWHFSADISMWSRPGGGGSACGWNSGGGNPSAWPIWPPPTAGGGKVKFFRGWWGAKMLGGKCKLVVVTILLSAIERWCIPVLTTGWWSWWLGLDCILGFLGPLSCWTAVKWKRQTCNLFGGNDSQNVQIEKKQNYIMMVLSLTFLWTAMMSREMLLETRFVLLWVATVWANVTFCICRMALIEHYFESL